LSGQPAVLQVVILRDGLLVGTEVFVPGSYTLGSAPDADLRLDDATVDAAHAVLYFQNGKAAVQDSGSSGGLYVNGHQVTACEIRAVDEVVVGPFVLKARVLGNKPSSKTAPPPELSALLGGGAPVAAAVPRVAPMQSPLPRRSLSTPPPPPAEAFAANPGPDAGNGQIRTDTPAPGTVPSARRRKTNTKSRLKPVAESELATTMPYPSRPANAADSGTTELDSFDEPLQRPKARQPPPAAQPPAPVAARAPAARPVPSSPPPVQPGPAPTPSRRAARPSGPVKAGPPRTFSIPSKGGRGPARIYFELFWGEGRQGANSFGPTKKDKPVTAGLLDNAMLPLYGFTLPEGFPIAESSGGGYRLFIPPRAELERRRADGTFAPVPPTEVEKSGGRRSVSLQLGSAVCLREGDMACVAFVAPPPERVSVNLFRNRPWGFLTLLLLFLSPSVYWVIFGPKLEDLADFSAKNLNPVAVRLLAPPKKEEKKKEPEKKKEEPKKEEAKKEPKKEPEKKVVAKPVPKPVPQPKVEPPKDMTKALAKVTAAGPAMKSMLAAINKIGPGGNNTAFKLSGLVGKGPVASTNGLPGIGIGKGGGGREILLGAGGGGIGALGVGSVGKGPVRSGVTKAVSTSIASQGQIDKEAVAKVINSHLAEVQRCYEAALMRTPGLAGKVVLEWSISTSGKVLSSKSKSSTLKDVSVEACILRALNNWQFPPAKGNSVIITYPFIFNSVGF
jgi:outer membrane biosynthesis protein TonB